MSEHCKNPLKLTEQIKALVNERDLAVSERDKFKEAFDEAIEATHKLNKIYKYLE